METHDVARCVRCGGSHRGVAVREAPGTFDNPDYRFFVCPTTGKVAPVNPTRPETITRWRLPGKGMGLAGHG